MSQPESALDHVLALSRAMLAAARAADWERLAAIEAEREPHVMQPHAAAPHAQQRLAEILACDRELMRLVAAARDAAAMQWKLESGRAQAIAAYGG